MTFTIVPTQQVLPHWTTSMGVLYIQDENICFQLIGGCISITWLDNAMQARKFCKHLRFSFNLETSMMRYLLETFVNFQAFLDMARYLELPDGAHTHPAYEMTVEHIPAHRVFSPFALHQLKPLPTIPDKWTLLHAKRALANNQFLHLVCTGKYSDDYAEDSATNCGKNVKLNALHLLEQLVERPFGWRSTREPDTNVVRVCQYHFDTNQFTLTLTPPALEVDVAH